jgi:hypothetical protein
MHHTILQPLHPLIAPLSISSVTPPDFHLNDVSLHYSFNSPTLINSDGEKMEYEYEPITTFFKPTNWSEDVSASFHGWQADGQMKNQFGLVSKYDWESFKQSIKGESV